MPLFFIPVKSIRANSVNICQLLGRKMCLNAQNIPETTELNWNSFSRPVKKVKLAQNLEYQYFAHDFGCFSRPRYLSSLSIIIIQHTIKARPAQNEQ